MLSTEDEGAKPVEAEMTSVTTSYTIPPPEEAEATAVPVGSSTEEDAAPRTNPGDGIRGLVTGVVVMDVIAVVCWILALVNGVLVWITLVACFVATILALVLHCKVHKKTPASHADHPAFGKRWSCGVVVSHVLTLAFWIVMIALSFGASLMKWWGSYADC